VSADYFDATMLNRQRLLWAVATRRQLERWELLVAAHILDSLAGREAVGSRVWAAEIEHHFALVAAHHLIVALDLPPASGVVVDPVLRAELIEGRHLHEHWPDNAPVFNVKPPPAPPPRQSGRAFAARNPGRSPYWWLGWSSNDGPQLMPQAAAQELHDLLDAVEAEVLASDPALADYVPARAPSPWLHEGGEWWPKPEGLDAA
jgi:hypothetical protein